MNRDDTIERLRARSKPWDVVVIGGGATGAGCCLDAVSRGLDVLLLEKSDFGKGASSRSTKLIHGGVRYLAQGNLRQVRQSLVERGRLIENAPHLVSKQEFIVPCESARDTFYYAAGLKLYDLLSGRLGFGKSKLMSRRKLHQALPNIVAEKAFGGVSYFDGRFDDTKLLLGILRTASNLGAAVVNYAPVKEVIKDSSGKVSGVRFECLESEKEYEVQARVVINATGAFTETVRKLSDAGSGRLLTFSQGTHLVFDGGLLESEKAILVPKTSDGRVLFAIPFYGKTLVGTTDLEVESPLDEPRALEKEIEFILQTCSEYFKEPPVRSDIKSVFAGIRPLVADKNKDTTAKISRGHFIETDKSGMVTITGGKWTTYRRMAEDAVDTAVKSAGLNAAESQTADMPIEDEPEFDTLGLDQELSPDFEWTVADIVKSVRFDMARTVEDVLARRTRILFLDAKEAIRLAPFTSELISSELGRDARWASEQASAFEEFANGYLPTTSQDNQE